MQRLNGTVWVSEGRYTEAEAARMFSRPLVALGDVGADQLEFALRLVATAKRGYFVGGR